MYFLPIAQAAPTNQEAFTSAVLLALDDPEKVWIIGAVYGVLLILGLAVDALLFVMILSQPPFLRRRVARLVLRPFTARQTLGLFLLLLMLFSLAGLAAVLLSAEKEGGPALGEGWLLALQSVLFHWTVLGALVWFLHRRGLSWLRAFGLRWRRLPRALGAGVLGYLAMVPAFLAFSFLYQMLLRLTGYEPELQDVVRVITRETTPWLRFYLFVVAVVLAPLAEEMVFRGMAFPVLARRIGPVGAALAVSLVFASIHAHPAALAPLFMVSLAFCAAYLFTGNILVPAVMHSLFNGVNLLLLWTLQ